MGRRKQISDEALLQGAREVFSEKGFSVSTRIIAKTLGVSEAVIYQRFESKAELFFAAMVPPGYDVEQLFDELHTGRNTQEQLQRIVLALMDYYRQVIPILLQLITHPSFDSSSFYAKNPASPDRRFQSRFISFLRQQHELGNIRVYNPQAVTGMFFSSIHGLVLFERLGVQGGDISDNVIKGMVVAFWNGLAPHRLEPA